MKDSKSKEKVLVVVKGGVVQSVYSSNTNIEIDVLDLDNENFDNIKIEERELGERSEGLVALL